MSWEHDLKAWGAERSGEQPSAVEADALVARAARPSGRATGLRWGLALATAAAVTLAVWSEVSTPTCLLYTSPSPRDATLSRMPSSA